MNYLSLRYFLAVANELNITRAAKKLYISQQSLSEHIGKLEAEYQVKLFERSPKLELTYAGKCLQELAEQVVSLDTQIEGRLQEISQKRRVKLSIGMSPVHGRIILPCILPQFYRENPDITLNLTLDKSDQIMQLLLDEKLDIVICFQPTAQDPSIKTTKLIQDRFCIVVAEKLLELVGLRYEEMVQSEQSLREGLEKIPFLMSLPGTRIYSAANLYFKDNNIVPRILLEIVDLEAQFSLCKSGMGAMFSFEIFARHRIQESKGGNMYFIPIDARHVNSELVLAFPRNHYQNQAEQAFISCTQNFFATEANQSFNMAPKHQKEDQTGVYL